MINMSVVGPDPDYIQKTNDTGELKLCGKISDIKEGRQCWLWQGEVQVGTVSEEK